MTLSKYALERLMLIIFEWLKQAFPYFIYIILQVQEPPKKVYKKSMKYERIVV